MELFAEQSIKDFGFQSLKERVDEFDREAERLKDTRPSADSPAKVFAQLNKETETLDWIQKEAAKFRKGLRVVSDLEAKIDWSVMDNFMTVKFGNEILDLDLHERIRQAIKPVETRTRMIRDNSREAMTDREGMVGGHSTDKIGRRSFLDHNSFERQMTAPTNLREMSPVLPSERNHISIKTPTGVREVVFPPFLEGDETRKFANAPSMIRGSMDGGSWEDSEIILNDLDTPTSKVGKLGVRVSSTYESNDCFLRPRVGSTESGPKIQPVSNPKVTAEGFPSRPSQARLYPSQKRLVIEGLQQYQAESLKANANGIIGVCELGSISNQAIDETKLKLILSELKVSQKNFERVEFVNNTFKCNYLKVLRGVITERLACEVRIDETRNKLQIKHKLTRKELDGFRQLNINIMQV